MKRVSKTDKIKIGNRQRKKGERDRVRRIYAKAVIALWREQQ